MFIKEGFRMKLETQIAKENIKLYEGMRGNVNSQAREFKICEEHKASCQRFLEFLENKKFWYMKCLSCKRRPVHFVLDFKEKITDLKQAISLYEKEGI